MLNVNIGKDRNEVKKTKTNKHDKSVIQNHDQFCASKTAFISVGELHIHIQKPSCNIFVNHIRSFYLCVCFQRLFSTEKLPLNRAVRMLGRAS